MWTLNDLSKDSLCDNYVHSIIILFSYGSWEASTFCVHVFIFCNIHNQLVYDLCVV